MGLLVSDYVVVYTSRLIHSSRPVNSNDGYSKSRLEFGQSSSISDPTERCVERQEEWLNKMQMVDQTCYLLERSLASICEKLL